MDIITKPLPLFLLGLAVSIAYIPGVIGASIPTGWFILIAVAPLCLFRLPGLFIIFVTLSLVWTTNFNIGFFFLLQLIALSCMFQLGERLKNPVPIFHGMLLGLGFSSLVALLQYFYNYTGVYAIETKTGAVAGLFVNSNIYSEVSAVLLIAIIALKLFWWIPVTLPGLLLVPSKSAFAALIICGFIEIFKKDKLIVLLILLAIICFCGIFIDKFNFQSIYQRLDLWADTIRGFLFKGNGVGSFEILYPLNAINIDTATARPRYAHNDLLQLIFEFGIGILILIPVIWKVIKSDSKLSIIVYAIGIISLFTYPFHVPMLAFIACLVAGYVSCNNDPICRVGNTSRSIIFKRVKTKQHRTI